MRLIEVKYRDLFKYGQDYRVILHEPNENRKYYALKENDLGNILACCEVEFKKAHIKINCVFVPEEYRGNGYAFDLIMRILFEN